MHIKYVFLLSIFKEEPQNRNTKRIYLGNTSRLTKAKKKILFVSCNGLKKNRVVRSVKNFRVGIVFNNKLVRVGFNTGNKQLFFSGLRPEIRGR